MATAECWYSDPVSAARREASAHDAAGVLSAAQVPQYVNHAGNAEARGWARFVGMVQDVWDTELYVHRDGNGGSALLDEVVSGTQAEATNSAERQVLGERLPVYLVAPPGLTKWAATFYDQGCRTCERLSSGQENRGSKRTRETCVVDESTCDLPARDEKGNLHHASGAAFQSCKPKKHQVDTVQQVHTNLCHPGMGLNTPCSGANGSLPFPAVVAKLYENFLSIPLKVNMLVEVIGVLHSGPVTLSAENEKCCGNEDPFGAEKFARNPVGIPRLHVVRMRVLEDTCSMNALLASVSLRDARADLRSNAMPYLRDVLVRYIASALQDDLLAAEYVLMSLLGRPAVRSEAGTVMGRLSVNVILPSSSSRAACDELTAAIESIMPAVVRIPVNISSLNIVDLYPRKDYEANRLSAAPLQLPAGCVVIADETSLDNGQLSERGVKNIRALTSVSTKAMLPVDFQYYESELLFDAVPLFVSGGCKSIIPSDVAVRVTPSANLHLQSWRTYEESVVNKLRMALSLLAENGSFEIPDDVTVEVENSFIAGRENGIIAGADGHETLSRWLSVARISARSFGEDALSKERWHYALDLEHRRVTSHAAAKSK